ncbi:MAG: ABC transporter ATP-binding protein [Alphaproteobacteria bacterium]
MRVEVHDLEWGPAAERILRGISLEVEPGRVIGIIGPNGSGKSSLLRCVYRFYRPTAGSVLTDGRDVWRMSARESARQTAVVVQETPADFGLTTQEVVQMGRAPHKRLFERDTVEDRRFVAVALEQVDMAGFAERRFETLSGGEKQRVLVARAIVQEPRLLVLDEPTNHLDIRYQFEVLKLVRGLGISVLTAVHDLNLAAAFCDRIHVMSQGRIVAEGTPDKVLTPMLIRQVFGVEAIVDAHPKTANPRITFHH